MTDGFVSLAEQNIPIFYFWKGISVRARRAIIRLNIQYIEDLNPATLEAIHRVRNCGPSTFTELSNLRDEVNHLRKVQRSKT